MLPTDVKQGDEIDPKEVEPENIDLCDCCDQIILPIPDTNINGKDTNVVDTNVFVLPPKSAEEKEKEEPVNMDSNATKIIATTELSPEEIEYERKTKEYEAKRSDLISQGWTEGKIDSNTEDPNNFETTSLMDQDNLTVNFKRKLPTIPEPTDSMLPIEPIEPTTPPTEIPLEPVIPVEEPKIVPTQEPKITKEELKRMVKNAIREVKKELKNKR